MRWHRPVRDGRTDRRHSLDPGADAKQRGGFVRAKQCRSKRAKWSGRSFVFRTHSPVSSGPIQNATHWSARDVPRRHRRRQPLTEHSIQLADKVCRGCISALRRGWRGGRGSLLVRPFNICTLTAGHTQPILWKNPATKNNERYVFAVKGAADIPLYREIKVSHSLGQIYWSLWSMFCHQFFKIRRYSALHMHWHQTVKLLSNCNFF